MKQQTISDVEYCARKRKTKREGFFEIMGEIIPWEEWVAYIAPYYPTLNSFVMIFTADIHIRDSNRCRGAVRAGRNRPLDHLSLSVQRHHKRQAEDAAILWRGDVRPVDVVFILVVNAYAIEDGQFNLDIAIRREALRHLDLLEALNRVVVNDRLTAIQNGKRLTIHISAISHTHAFSANVAYVMV